MALILSVNTIYCHSAEKNSYQSKNFLVEQLGCFMSKITSSADKVVLAFPFHIYIPFISFLVTVGQLRLQNKSCSPFGIAVAVGCCRQT